MQSINSKEAVSGGERRSVGTLCTIYSIFCKPKTALETAYLKNLYPWTYRYLAKADFSDHFPQEIYSSTSF